MSDAISILFAKDAKLLWLEAGSSATPEMFGPNYTLPGAALLDSRHTLSDAVEEAVDVGLPDDHMPHPMMRPWIMAGGVLYSPGEISDLYTLRPTV
jgi:hypothetical protein